MIPAISISEGVPTIFMPLFVILLVTAAKDFYEDFKRRTSDNEENKVEGYLSRKLFMIYQLTLLFIKTQFNCLFVCFL